ncbi:type II toxin-antitoxin system HigA family antitoxin [Salipiger sp. PrR003]|uniref:helix-turn-helix domain-containing protein n=1 Tax=Salipiger sp. PrR003 TaxID=2706776 RepID=UPI0013DA58FD|nr:transcriptional regulator [Salipiger sp. PrR003]NDV52111.1 transcriptional regulator [Salipiger sp. PrR003]
MSIRPIRTEEDHRAALGRIEALWGAEPGTADGDELDILVDLVEHYEDKHFPMPEVDPIEFIRAHMDATGRSQADLANLFGSRPRASEVLNRKRALTVDMIYKITREWHVPAGCLVKPYHLNLEPA